jgi:hypothetical protein
VSPIVSKGLAALVRNFDNGGWDQGELAWVLKTWD